MKKQIFLIVLLVICLTGVSAVEVMAAGPTSYNIETSIVTITSAGNYYIYGTNTPTANTIRVAGNISGNVNITLENVKVITTGNNTSAFAVDSGTNVNFILKSTNLLAATGTGIHTDTMTITGQQWHFANNQFIFYGQCGADSQVHCSDTKYDRGQ